MHGALVAILLLAGAKGPEVPAPRFFRPLKQAQRGEWLYLHPEPGQTLSEYQASDPVRGTDRRRVVYLQPWLTRPPDEDRLTERMASLLSAWFQREVRVLPGRPMPARAYDRQSRQFRIGVLVANLAAKRPADALLVLAVTDRDLRLGSFDHAFGWGSLKHRVAILSTARLGRGEDARRRALGLAVHEATHCLSLLHCTYYRCLMNGAASPQEADRRPLQLCPECLAKLDYSVGIDPARRYPALAEVFEKAGLKTDAARTVAAQAAMKALKTAKTRNS